MYIYITSRHFPEAECLPLLRKFIKASCLSITSRVLANVLSHSAHQHGSSHPSIRHRTVLNEFRFSCSLEQRAHCLLRPAANATKHARVRILWEVADQATANKSNQCPKRYLKSSATAACATRELSSTHTTSARCRPISFEPQGWARDRSHRDSSSKRSQRPGRCGQANQAAA